MGSVTKAAANQVLVSHAKSPNCQLGLAVVNKFLTRSGRSPKGLARIAKKRCDYCTLDLLIVTAGLASSINFLRKQCVPFVDVEASSPHGVHGLGNDMAST